MRAARLTLYTLFLAGCTAFAWMFPKEHAPRAITNTLGGIDPKQRIDVAGAHKFIAAGSDDFRGPCPGLNALANHNYIPRNGIVSVLEAIIVSFNGVFPENMNDTAPTYRRAVFGLGPDIGLVAGILALYGADLLDIPFFDFSIGGPPPSLLGILFGGPTGLSGTHNQFESDSSATRCDLYDPACDLDNYSVKPEYLQSFLGLLEANPDPKNNLDVVIEHRVNRLRHSKANNPFFFYGPVEMIVSCLTHNLITGLLSNHSAAFPDGYLSSDGLRSLYGVAPGPDGQLQYNRGTERIPPNWFRRPFVDPYIDPTHGLPDLIYMWTKYSETLIIGGNTNGTDTFAPIDISDLTNGVYSTELLLVGSNAACFLFQFLQIALPGILTNIEAIAAGLLAQVAAQLGLPLLSPACPVLEGMKLELLEKFPGYMKSRKP